MPYLATAFLILLMTPLWRDYFAAREQFQRDLAAHRAEQDAYIVAEARARQTAGPDETPGPSAGTLLMIEP